MKTVKEVNSWWDKLEKEKALYVWGMNGDVITDKTIKAAYAAYKNNTYDWEYYSGKLAAGPGRIGADCSGAFMPLAGGDNTAAGYYAGCISKGKIATLPVDKPCMVFKRNSSGNIYHIGWYRPDKAKTVSEMASSALNFRRIALAGAGWSDWGIPKFVNYEEPAPAKKCGWVQENGGWRICLGNSGQYIKNDWYKDDNKWYWFDGAGMMVSNTWYKYNGEWYFLGSDGSMSKGLQSIAGKWYYMDADGIMASKPVTLTPGQDGALQYPGLAQ